jgi:heme exporter protein D
MIDLLGPHGGYILVSYGATVLVIAGLVGWVVADHAGLSRRLADLEARGVRRRSARPAATAGDGREAAS